MLVLTRRAGERLVIGGDIVITVIEVRNDGVRIGIDAPRHVRVHRAEVLEAVSDANASSVAAGDAAAAALRGLVAVDAPAAAPAAAAPAPAPEGDEGTPQA
ncbi:carbon storage regulator CsrA [Cellulomonas sp. SLBN-39]|uniref:carbon storage regulator CsrA n=1 Tax=Cellulomonas sp. SLBN-39 TaxID=2768446 RepID=UPI00114F807D|nr:carbon storage regulator CsrA [Cellulomonas sp. SLBN-39]TQL01615.1 carbon storage regulator CsrA [Cellulomonas sp. SLBN-39]